MLSILPEAKDTVSSEQNLRWRRVRRALLQQPVARVPVCRLPLCRLSWSQEGQMQQPKKLGAFVLATLILFMTAMPSLAQAPTTTGAGLTVPVQGTARGAGRVTGTFTIQRFVDNGGQLGAFGTLVLTTAQGQTAVTQAVMPVTATHRPSAAAPAAGAAIQAVCEVLDLTLGPLDLNLLGLVIHLDTVHLDIDANPAGGLLGQLLSGLLCGSDLGTIFGNLTQLVNFLNAVLAALGGILGGV
jgi:hypothetical protein